MFLLFVVLVAVIIMNLIVAITINATDELKKTSGIIQAEKKIKDIYKEGIVDQNVGGSSTGIFKKFQWKIMDFCGWKLLNNVHRFSMVKDLLEDKQSNKICLSKKKQKRKQQTLNPLTWHLFVSLQNAWNGGNYRLYSFKLRKFKKIGINAPDNLILQTKETLQKITQRKDELSSKVQAIKNDMNNRWKDLEKEKNNFK